MDETLKRLQVTGIDEAFRKVSEAMRELPNAPLPELLSRVIPEITESQVAIITTFFFVRCQACRGDPADLDALANIITKGRG